MVLEEIPVDQLSHWREKRHRFVLLDVREPHELELASIEGAVHIPMREIPERYVELNAHDEIAVLCHHGGRSARVASFLVTHGFLRVFNVAGGIDEYAARIDPTIPRY